MLELGTYSGYSSLSMAAGLPEGGHIDTCEFDETHAEVARRYIARSPYADRITVHLGPALETIQQLEGEFDFVFIDADKENYLELLRGAAAASRAARPDGHRQHALERPRAGRGGRLEATRAIRELNDRIARTTACRSAADRARRRHARTQGLNLSLHR